MRRLYNAVCSWLEADADARLRDDPEYPEGSTATVEHAPGTKRQDLHADANRESIDNDDGGVYRLGFNTQHQGGQMLRQNIQELTETHLKMGPAGKPVQAPSLLSELRAAVKPGNDGGGSGGATTAPIPINPDAVDLLTSITHEAHVDYVEMHGVRYRGPLEGLLQTHADLADDWEAYLDGVMLGWIDRINSLLRPQKPRYKLGVECPSCEQRFHGESRAVCLTADCWGPDEKMLNPAAWHVQCEGCGAEWVGDSLKWLVAALNTPSQEVANAS